MQVFHWECEELKFSIDASVPTPGACTPDTVSEMLRGMMNEEPGHVQVDVVADPDAGRACLQDWASQDIVCAITDVAGEEV